MTKPHRGAATEDDSREPTTLSADESRLNGFDEGVRSVPQPGVEYAAVIDGPWPVLAVGARSVPVSRRGSRCLRAGSRSAIRARRVPDPDSRLVE